MFRSITNRCADFVQGLPVYAGCDQLRGLRCIRSGSSGAGAGMASGTSAPYAYGVAEIDVDRVVRRQFDRDGLRSVVSRRIATMVRITRGAAQRAQTIFTLRSLRRRHTPHCLNSTCLLLRSVKRNQLP